MTMPKRYKPLEWDFSECIDIYTRNTVNAQRERLWDAGVRTEPSLTLMAFEYAAVIMKAKKP